MIKIGSKLKILKTANKATSLLNNGQISKVASAEDDSQFNNDFVYFIARALTANVPNANGDYFPIEELKKSYESFIGKNLHLNHDADDVSKAVGKIIDAWFIETEDDTYVVCLCKIDRKLHPELARNVETGIIDSVSMGCSCQECECSICGKVAHNESEMCEHLRNFLGREIEVNGEKKLVSSINRGITFNELSLVGDPADCNAHMYQIYASKGNNMKKKALQNDVTEERIQDEIKPELEKAEDVFVEEKKVEEEPVTKEEVKEEVKEVEEKLEEVKDVVEEKLEEVKEVKEEVKDIKEESVEEKVEEVIDEKESCNKKAETEESVEEVKEEVVEEKVEEAVEDKVEEVKDIVEEKLEEVKEEIKEEVEEPKEEKTEEVKEEVVEEIKKEEDIDKKAEDSVEDIEKVEEEVKEDIVEDKAEETKEEVKIETVEDAKEVIEEIKEDIAIEVGDIVSAIADKEENEFEVKDIYEDNGEKFIETEIEGKKKVYALKNVKLKKSAKKDIWEVDGFTYDTEKEAYRAFEQACEEEPNETHVIRKNDEEIEVSSSKNVKLKKSATAPEKPTTAPSAGMKWVFNQNTNSWEQKPESMKTVEVQASDVKKIFIVKKDNDVIYDEDIEKVKPYIEKGYELIESKETKLDDYINGGCNVKKATTEYKYTLIKSGKNPRWLIIDKATNKIAYKLYLKDLPKEANSFGYKQVIAKSILENGLEKTASLLKKAIKVDDVYTLNNEDGSTSTLKVKSISINDMTKETFINVQIGEETDSDNIFSLSKFMKMLEDGQLVKKGDEVKEEVVEEVAENGVEITEDGAPMNQDETAEPMNDLQSSKKIKLNRKASFWEVKKDEETGKYYLDSAKGEYKDAEGHTYKFNSREDALEEIDFLDAEHKYKKEIKNKKADAGDGQLVPESEQISEENLVPSVEPTEANTLANGEVEQPAPVEEVTPKEEVAELVGDLTKAVIEMEEDKVDFVKQEVQDAIDYINGKPIEEIEKGEEEILEFSDITWEDTENKELPEVASVDVDDINFNNVNAQVQGARILASIYKAQPKSFKVVAKKMNRMNKVAGKINKVSFVQVMEDLVKKAQDEVKAIHLTAQLKEKKATCDTIVKEAINKGLVHIDSSEIKKNILQGMSQVEAREMAVRKAADEQVKNLMAMDEVSLKAYKDTVSNFVLKNVKQDKGISRIVASADYDEVMSVEIPWSRHK